MEFLSHIHHLDKDITLAINSAHCAFTDSMWLLFSAKKIWFILYLIVIIFLIRNLGWKKALVSILAVILTIVCCDQFSNLIKDSVQRLRPCCDLDMLQRGLRCLQNHRPIEYGFFSAHAANAMGFAAGTILAFRNDGRRNYKIYGYCVIAWALMVGFSRVFVGMHYLGDVLTGFCIGAAFAAIWAWIAGLVIRRYLSSQNAR